MENQENIKNNYKVSVIVLTFNPIWEKLKLTLCSIIKQEDIDIQIVVSDDGSKENLFKKIEEFLQQNNFKNYLLVASEKNQGTVKNLYQGLQKCTGKYIKPISPGDFLSCKTTLYKWSTQLEKSQKKWSFADAVYYRLDQFNNLQAFNKIAHPRNASCYIKGNQETQRWNYLVLDDNVLGAATLIEAETFNQYINRILDKVTFAEDNCYRIMMFDNVLPLYFNEIVVFYEFGSGISTKEDQTWFNRLMEDWENTTALMLENTNAYDGTQLKIIDALQNKKSNSSKESKFINKLVKLKIMLSKRSSLSKIQKEAFNIEELS